MPLYPVDLFDIYIRSIPESGKASDVKLEVSEFKIDSKGLSQNAK
ncbi:hypothetical protein C408_4526 [Vibrio diabolicus E0666]|nr:hypothetical protein C408_4526 [Vibrio diabolicus E0666]